MTFSENSKLAYVFSDKNEIVLESGQLKYNTNAEAFAALVHAEGKDHLILKAKEFLIEVFHFHQGHFSLEQVDDIKAWIEEEQALQIAEKKLKTNLQAAIDKANNQQP